MIVSPSLWWDNESPLKLAPGLLQKQNDQNIHVYISVGREGKQMEGDAKQLAEIIEASGKKNLLVNFVQFPNESHLTILHNSVYKGLEILHLKKTD